MLWATGSPWPAKDRATLADLMAGRPAGGVPSAAACVGVAGLLGAAALLVAGHPRRVSRAGTGGVVAVLATRGAFGLAGRTDLLAPGSTSPAFRRRDRRVYSPLCLALAACAAPAMRPGGP